MLIVYIGRINVVWKIAGKPLKRLDTADKLTGKQLYSMDVKLPGMLHAAVKESPVFGGKVKSFDAAKVMGMLPFKGAPERANGEDGEGGEVAPGEGDFDDDDMKNSLSLAAIEAELARDSGRRGLLLPPSIIPPLNHMAKLLDRRILS